MSFNLQIIIIISIMSFIGICNVVWIMKLEKQQRVITFQFRALTALIIKPTIPGCEHSERTRLGKYAWCIDCGNRV